MKLGLPLSQLTGSVVRDEHSLAVRNLLHGLALGLPSGQDVARAMGITPLTAAQLRRGVTFDRKLLDERKLTVSEEAVLHEVERRAPLWFYVLKEAEELAGGAHLGPVGARIVAEVLVGLLDGDPLSYLSVDPSWTPTLPATTLGTFTLADLINLGQRAGQGGDG